ncbi:DNA mismatch repair protein MutT [Tsuneonella deserti]|uniref:GDP-mannose pyrophosphatase n=1 Tax=Tsuneonella deserti TaxID=2035528 RepID=A0ABQ1SAI7_9SPHN|nr:NUDIX hydrolase [Tsuneonella deserti]GGD96285.1 DNA mismatch repair protein MutT [Tsuneonella deserti]
MSAQEGTLPPDAGAPEEVVWEGRFVTAKKRGRWEYVSRARGIRAAVIVAIDGGHVILVEQYRVPMGRASLEMPAGLVGDGDDDGDEEAETAARRELEEETGYRAHSIEDCGLFYSSPGMLSESFHLFRATELERVGDGGGTASENITVHRVALDEVPAFVEERRKAGVGIDTKLMLLLGGAIIGRKRA